MEWSNQDPREIINKRAKIIVFNLLDNEVFIGDVETKHAYCIFFRGRLLDQNTFVSADDDWPQEWRWTFTPRK